MDQTKVKKEEKNNGTKWQFVEPKAFRNDDFLTLVLPNDITISKDHTLVIRKHINFYKSIMGVPYKPKEKKQSA